MASITGMKTGSFTDLNIQGPVRVGNALDPGTIGQVLISNGENEATEWGTNSAVVPNALTAGTNITYTSGNATWDGAIADTINATDTDTTYSAGNGIDLTGTTFSTDNDGTTINNTGGTGTQNQVLKVPNALTAGTGIQLVGGSGPVASYSGDDATTINCTITDTTYQGGDNITIDTTTNPDTIDLDSAITGMTGITYSGSGGNNLTGAGMPGTGTTCTYLDLTSNTNLMPSLYPEQVKPYLVFDVYDPTLLDSDALTSSYAQIFSGNLSNSFTAKTTSVEVQLQIFNSSSSGNRWFYLRLSDGSGNEWSTGAGTGGGTGTGTRNTERLIHYADEHDRQTIVMSWYLEGLSIASSYTINPYAKTSSTYNNIYAGGSYPACILKVINL